MKETCLKNKKCLDKILWLNPKPIQNGDWILVYINNLENQHSIIHKLPKCWFGPNIVIDVYCNATYLLRVLNGTMLQLIFVKKRVKLFKSH